jgi:putative thioredoxin
VSGPDSPAAPAVIDVDEASFPVEVIERSHEVPVVVDFWAAWCGPCRTLGPMLESAVAARHGQVVLAKVDVDRNQTLARTYQVQGIPQVLGFRDGRPVAQFTGAVPPQQIEVFLDGLAPSEADQAVVRARALEGSAREAHLRQALELDPGHREAAIGLADLLVDADPDAALELMQAHRPDPAAEAIVTRAELARAGGVDVDGLRARVETDADGSSLLVLGRALAAAGEYDEAIDRLLAAVELGGETREEARGQLVALFGLLGDGDERVKAARPRLARALF